MKRTELGKIKSAEFGFGGYQDAMIGVKFDLGGDSWGIGDFWGQWATDHSEHCKWSHAERIEGLGKDVWRLKDLLEKAKKRDVSQLKGIPIEVTLEANTLVEWRVLEEVL